MNPFSMSFVAEFADLLTRALVHFLWQGAVLAFSAHHGEALGREDCSTQIPPFRRHTAFDGNGPDRHGDVAPSGPLATTAFPC